MAQALTTNLTLGVPHDDDDGTARGGLPQFVEVLA